VTLAIVVLGLYARTMTFEFTTWDDPIVVTDNPYVQSLSLDNLKHILVPGGIRDEFLYVPIPYLTFLTESVLLRAGPAVRHAVNVLLHLTNVLLLYYLILALGAERVSKHNDTTTRNTVWKPYCRPAFIAALLMATHPLQVETVAWIAARKDLLAALFALLTLLTYVRHLQTNNRRLYVVSVICAVSAFLSKPTTVTLPVVLPLLWTLVGKKPARATILGLIPFVLFSGLTLMLQPSSPASGSSAWMYMVYRATFIPPVIWGWTQRVLLIARPGVFYSWYSHASPDNIQLTPVVFCLGYILTTTILWRRRRTRVPAFGLTFACVAFLPALSLVSISYRDFITADRYGYLPLTGVFLAAAWALDKLVSRWRVPVIACVTAWGVGAILSTWLQVGVWRNTGTLWQTAIKRDPLNYVAYHNLGNFYFRTEQYDLAAAYLARGLAILPDAYGYYTLGVAYRRLNATHQAETAFRRTISLFPDTIAARLQLAEICLETGRSEDAKQLLEQVLQLDPNNNTAREMLGTITRGQLSDGG